jgi:hypothetical protein
VGEEGWEDDENDSLERYGGRLEVVERCSTALSRRWMKGAKEVEKIF